ncbi:hypothetical protein M407DRAFT_190862 [Tulasnella calospora MUT 4182]|uniref:Uncharacterized protein n=1 Tax=Tulasnella calospora MUT 4182 TaxID=1051891 RepID=A0A0C3QJW0_9AGAM|nr:hypothetical protein M407DRAFT_190862 [Tulasnella calospora MUT 4182]
MMTTAVAIPLHQFHHHHPHHQPSSNRTTSMPGSSRPSLPSATAAPPITTISQAPSSSRLAMQSHPPPQLRSRTSNTTITRPVSPPIPPSLIDSPYIQDPNSPFRRDYSHSPAGPSYNTGHDRLNLLDTVPMGEDPKRYLELRRGSLEPAELPPDDIGVAGAPKSARTSDMTTNRSTRPGMPRGNSWILQQQQRAGSGASGAGVAGSYPSISPSQSTVKLPASQQQQRYPPSNALPPISTPLPVPTRYQHHQPPPPGSSLAASPNAASKGPSPGSTAISAATR